MARSSRIVVLEEESDPERDIYAEPRLLGVCSAKIARIWAETALYARHRQRARRDGRGPRGLISAAGDAVGRMRDDHGAAMTMYVLSLDGAEPVSINAHGDEGAEILAASCLTGEMPPQTRVLLTTEDGRRVIIDATVGTMRASA